MRATIYVDLAASAACIPREKKTYFLAHWNTLSFRYQMNTKSHISAARITWILFRGRKLCKLGVVQEVHQLHHGLNVFDLCQKSIPMHHKLEDRLWERTRTSFCIRVEITRAEERGIGCCAQ